MSERDGSANLDDVRHEINNALMGIIGQVEILEMRGDLPEDAAARLRSILEEADRIRDAVKKIATGR